MKLRRWLWWALLLVGVALALKFGADFPWGATVATLLGADRWLLTAALLLNLVSLVAKGSAWHFLLKPAGTRTWRSVQEANLLGAAVDNLAISVGGEAARARLISKQSGIPLSTVISSIVWTRLAEGLGMALFLVIAPTLLDLAPWLRDLQLGAGLALVTLLLLTWGRGLRWLIGRLPTWARGRVAPLAAMGSGGRLLLPVLWGLLNWAAQWATYHLTLLAIHLSSPLAASYSALIAVNLGGLLRLTPANLGVAQAAMVLGLLPFQIPAEQAVAAGLALQGIQVLPVLALGALVAGRRLLKGA